MEYSNPSRKNDPYALPDIEVFRIPEDYVSFRDTGELKEKGWYFWYCFPGCLPDSDPIGPFDSYDLALEAARSEGLE